MDPITLLTIGMGLQVFGELRQGVAAAEASEYNQELLEQAIKDTDVLYDYYADKIRREKRQTEGTQVARYAKAGVKIEGTPLEVLAETAAQYEEDLVINEYNRRLAISELEMGIAAEKYREEEAVVSSVISAASTLLQGYGMMKTTSTYGYWGS